MEVYNQGMKEDGAGCGASTDVHSPRPDGPILGVKIVGAVLHSLRPNHCSCLKSQARPHPICMFVISAHSLRFPRSGARCDDASSPPPSPNRQHQMATLWQKSVLYKGADWSVYQGEQGSTPGRSCGAGRPRGLTTAAGRHHRHSEKEAIHGISAHGTHWQALGGEGSSSHR